jgi:hypothetical protein
MTSPSLRSERAFTGSATMHVFQHALRSLPDRFHGPSPLQEQR